MRASTSWPGKARRSSSTSPAARCGSAAKSSPPRSPRASSRPWSGRAESFPPSSTTARRSSKSSLRRFDLHAGSEQEARDHVVAGDGADQLDHLLVGKQRAHLVDGGLLHLHVPGHLYRALQSGHLGGVEELRIRFHRPERGDLLLPAAGHEELAVVLPPLVVRPVELRDGT